MKFDKYIKNLKDKKYKKKLKTSLLKKYYFK